MISALADASVSPEGTPNLGYGIASTPGLDGQTPGTADPYLPSASGDNAPAPAMASTPAFADIAGRDLICYTTLPNISSAFAQDASFDPA